MNAAEFVRRRILARRRADAAESFRTGKFRTLVDAYASVDTEISDAFVRQHFEIAVRRAHEDAAIISRYGHELPPKTVKALADSVEFYRTLTAMLAKGAA